MSLPEGKTLKMPEKTVNGVRDKINCFNADNLDLRERVQLLEMQIQINIKHRNRLFLRLRDLVQK